MKYIITEEQNKVMQVLRRIDTDWPLITEIVDEGTDLDDPCDFRDSKTYLMRIRYDSSRTYLFHYFDNEREKGFEELFHHVAEIIKERLGKDITEYYNEKIIDCRGF